MTWRPISRKCWTLVPSRSCTVHGLVQWSWSERRTGACGSVLTSGDLTIEQLRVLTHYPTLRRPSNACRGPNGSLHLTWSLGTGRLRWMRQANCWLHYWGPLGFYECNRMPFWLTNAPTTFQQLMETCLRDLNLNWCIIYLDGIVIFSKDLASHLERLEAMFQKLEQARLKLEPSKCELFHRQITHLWNIVSAQGLVTDEGKIDAIRNGLPPPLSLRSDLSLGSWVITASSSSGFCR